MKKLPIFKSESDEQVFWKTHDSTDYVDWGPATPATFPNLRPTTRSISLRLPEMMIQHLKQLAHKRDIPYQSLIKVFLQDCLSQSK